MNKTLTNIVSANDILTVTELPQQDELRVAGRIVIPRRFESSVLSFSTAAGLQIIKSKPSTIGKGEVIVLNN